MNPEQKKILPIIVLQILPLILFPPSLLASGWLAMVLLAVIFVLLGIALIRGKNWALSMSLFMQGINIVVRMMMVFPNSQIAATGAVSWEFVITSILAIGLSLFFLLRLDQPDIRSVIS
jgi:hypothetical protein